jgi:hypothetical protein
MLEETKKDYNKENATESVPTEVTASDAEPLKVRAQPKAAAEELMWIGNGGKVDLRQNFERFKKQKVEQIKYRKYVTEQATVDKKDPAVKKRLREKFLELAKKYFGVPYAKRYFNPGEPLYDAPIFLDCCALVR